MFYVMKRNTLNPTSPVFFWVPGPGGGGGEGGRKVAAANNSKIIYGIEMKFCRIVENHKLIILM